MYQQIRVAVGLDPITAAELQRSSSRQRGIPSLAALAHCYPTSAAGKGPSCTDESWHLRPDSDAAPVLTSRV